MTTTGTTPVELGPRPALTVDEVTTAVRCPLCGADYGVECEHPLSRLRAALALQAQMADIAS